MAKNETAASGGQDMPAEQVTMDQVKILIAEESKRITEAFGECLKGLVAQTDFQIVLSGLVTKDELHEALLNISPPVSATLVSGLPVQLGYSFMDGDDPVLPVPEEHLAGLVFRSSKEKRGENGKINLPTERPLRPSDVLSWRDNGDTVGIVAADGQKHTVAKNEG